MLPVVDALRGDEVDQVGCAMSSWRQSDFFSLWRSRDF